MERTSWLPLNATARARGLSSLSDSPQLAFSPFGAAARRRLRCGVACSAGLIMARAPLSISWTGISTASLRAPFAFPWGSAYDTNLRAVPIHRNAARPGPGKRSLTAALFRPMRWPTFSVFKPSRAMSTTDAGRHLRGLRTTGRLCWFLRPTSMRRCPVTEHRSRSQERASAAADTIRPCPAGVGLRSPVHSAVHYLGAMAQDLPGEPVAAGAAPRPSFIPQR